MTKADKAVVLCFLGGFTISEIVTFTGIDRDRVELAIRAYAQGVKKK